MKKLLETVFINGDMVPYEKAQLHVEDRGNLFADAVYEQVRYYNGCAFEMHSHMKRFQESARALKIAIPYSTEKIMRWADDIVKVNNLRDASLYLQLSRGRCKRDYSIPQDNKPNIFMIARPTKSLPKEVFEKGVKCITVDDRRGKMCNVKNTGKIVNVLARQEAIEKKAYEAIFVRDGIVTEGATTNVFAVINGCLLTHGEGEHILSGVTRSVVIELAKRMRIDVKETPFTASEMRQAQEVFITGTSIEILPVTYIDDEPVGDEKPGDITTDLSAAFRAKRSHL